MGRKRGKEKDGNLCPLPLPAPTWSRAAHVQFFHSSGESRFLPASRLHRMTAGMAVGLLRDLRYLLTGSSQTQPLNSLQSALWGNTDMTHPLRTK